MTDILLTLREGGEKGLSASGAAGGAASSWTRYGPVAVVARGVGLCGVVRRKRPGNGFASPGAHRCAALSQENVRIRPYKEPGRERIQSLGATSHLFARLTNLRIPDVSSLRRTSFSVAKSGRSASETH